MLVEQELHAKGGKVFTNPTPELMKEISFGFVWDHHRHFNSPYSKVISPFEWSIIEMGAPSQTYLRDSRGESRQIGKFEYHEAIESPTWEAYDLYVYKGKIGSLQSSLQSVEKKLEEKEKEVEGKEGENRRLFLIMSEVFDVNEKGGPGSRKKVRELLVDTGVEPCEECGLASCACGDR